MIDLGKLINALPPDVNKKLSLHDLKRVCDNYNAGVRPGDRVKLGKESEFSYEVAEIRMFPHGLMVGIYDEPPSKHVDFWNSDSVYRVTDSTDRGSIA